MRSPCLIESMSTSRASGLRSSPRYFSQYFGECASVCIWSSASVSAVRSPFFAASRSSPRIFWPLIRDGGFFAMRARCYHDGLSGPRSPQLDVIVLAVRLLVHGLHDHLHVQRRLEPRQILATFVLQIRRQVGVHARDHFVARRLGLGGDLGLDHAIALGGEGFVPLVHPAAAPGGTGDRQ